MSLVGCILVMCVHLGLVLASSAETQADIYYYSVDLKFYNVSQKFCFERVGLPLYTKSTQLLRWYVIQLQDFLLFISSVELPYGYQIDGKSYMRVNKCATIIQDVFLRYAICSDAKCESCGAILTPKYASGENFCSFTDNSNGKYLANYQCNRCYCEDCSKVVRFPVSTGNSIALTCLPGQSVLVDRIAAVAQNAYDLCIISSFLFTFWRISYLLIFMIFYLFFYLFICLFVYLFICLLCWCIHFSDV
jgi:hypothetical protein